MRPFLSLALLVVLSVSTFALGLRTQHSDEGTDPKGSRTVLLDFLSIAGSANQSVEMLALFSKDATVEVPWGVTTRVPGVGAPNCSIPPPQITAAQFIPTLTGFDKIANDPDFAVGYSNDGGLGHAAAFANVTATVNGTTTYSPHIFMAKINTLTKKITHLRGFYDDSASNPTVAANLKRTVTNNYKGYCEGNFSATMAQFSKQVTSSVFLHGTPLLTSKAAAAAAETKSICGYVCVEAEVRAMQVFVHLKGKCHLVKESLLIEPCGGRVASLYRIELPPTKKSSDNFIHEFSALRSVKYEAPSTHPLIIEYDMWSRLYGSL